MNTKPPSMRECHFDFLNNLRDSGVTNMFGSGQYLKEAYPDLSRNEVKDIVLHWMGTYDERCKL